MEYMNTRLVVSFTIVFMVHLAIGQDLNQDNWPQWRGPLGTGESLNANPPITWDENKNIKWKVDIPGKGHATPVIWDDRIFILTSIATSVRETGFWDRITQYFYDQDESVIKTDQKHQFAVICINRHSGEFLWQSIVKEEVPRDHVHKLSTWASNSPVTDGEYLYAYFGSRGLFCLDMEGNIIWKKDLGPLNKSDGMGEGSSPVLHGNRISILRDHEGDSFLEYFFYLTIKQ